MSKVRTLIEEEVKKVAEEFKKASSASEMKNLLLSLYSNVLSRFCVVSPPDEVFVGASVWGFAVFAKKKLPAPVRDVSEELISEEVIRLHGYAPAEYLLFRTQEERESFLAKAKNESYTWSNFASEEEQEEFLKEMNKLFFLDSNPQRSCAKAMAVFPVFAGSSEGAYPEWDALVEEYLAKVEQEKRQAEEEAFSLIEKEGLKVIKKAEDWYGISISYYEVEGKLLKLKLYEEELRNLEKLEKAIEELKETEKTLESFLVKKGIEVEIRDDCLIFKKGSDFAMLKKTKRLDDLDEISNVIEDVERSLTERSREKENLKKRFRSPR